MSSVVPMYFCVLPANEVGVAEDDEGGEDDGGRKEKMFNEDADWDAE